MIGVKKLEKSIDDIYRELMGNGGISSIYSSSTTPYDHGINEDDGEDFVTSKEIVKEQKLLEEQFGKKRPGSGSRGGDGKIEEEAHFKRFTTRREHKYTESEKQAIRESCVATIVHDYSEHDIYHQSDEDRAANDALIEIRGKLSRLKRIYYKVDEFIEAMRVVMEAWAILEKGNIIHTTDEFYELVAEGRIYSSSIIMPKLKRMDNYNMDMLIKYISNPDANAKDLVPVTNESRDPFYDNFMLTDDETYQRYQDEYIESLTEEQIEEIGSAKVAQNAHEYAVMKMDEDRMKRLLSPEEIDFITEYADNPPPLVVHDIKRKYVKGYDRREFGKKKKRGSKRDRYIREDLHAILNKIQSNSDYNPGAQYSRSYLVTHSMFDFDKPEKDFWENLRFDGSWANDDDVFLYNLAVREELLKQHPTNQRYLTYSDQELDKFFATLEEAGINTLELRRSMNIIGTDGVETSASVAAKRKENKKLESMVLQRITKLNQSPKFKKLVSKAERDLNRRFEEG